MKKILLTICLAPLMLYAVELHPEDDCLTYKSNLVSFVYDFYSLQTDDIYGFGDGYIRDAIFWSDSAAYNIKLYQSRHPDDIQYDTALPLALEQIGTVTNDLITFNVLYEANLSSLSNAVDSLDCTSCPSSGSSTNCCDFTEIIAHIDSLKNEVSSSHLVLSQVNNYIKTFLPSIVTNLQYVAFLVDHGFSDVTNQVSVIGSNLTNILSVVNNTLDSGFYAVTNLMNYGNTLVSDGFYNTTNLLSTINDSSLYLSTNFWFLANPSNRRIWEAEIFPQVQYVEFPYYSGYGASAEFVQSPFIYTLGWNFPQFTGLLPSLYLQGYENIGIGYAQLNWEQYKNDTVYPPITNSLNSIYIQQTNYFSFFRGQLGVNGVLSDWTPQDGGYYDFLTNHYLSIMRGDTLPPSLSTKTNWFSRIETLLAALVFPESQTTNVVDSSAFSNEQQALQGAISSVNTSASTSFSSFNSSANSIVTLFQNYSQTFDDVALPGRFVLFTLSNVDGDSDVVSFSMSENPALNLFVEGCRAVTTFSWASVGIFCLLRFMIWACRSIFYACVFLYKAISSVLR